MGEDGKWVEVQIRSKRMDEIAERGYAAHWHYKNQDEKSSSLDLWINKISSLLENPESNAIDFIDDFKLNLYSGEIFVFTPKGDLKTLPKGATALDFAFEIHTQIGMTCLGVKVNGKLVALSHELSSGDQVEIITSRKQHPRKDWLRFVVTSHARTRIKSALKREEKVISEKGKELAERKLRHLRTKLSRDTENQLIKFFKSTSSQELYFRFGNGQISNKELKEFVNLKNSGWYQNIKNRIYSSKYLSKKPVKNNLIVFNEDDEILDYKISKCCNAIPGDNIFGFLSIVDGLKVHREDCPNAIELRANYAYRILKAKWTTKQNLDFTANLKLNGIDSVGLVNKVTQIISKQLHVDIKSINIYTHDGVFEGEITLKVHNETFLSEITKKLEKIEGIVKISRTYKHSRNIKV
jgi:GTP pyrophosphokinase